MDKTNEQIKILFIGDMVGRPGRDIVKYYLGALGVSEENQPYDFVIANVENASHGFGLTEKNHNELANAGIDCFTSGNHIWDKKDIYSYINNSDRLIRPWNYPKGTYGVGYRIFSVKNTKVAVLNFLGRTFMNPVDSPWEIIQNEIENIKKEAPIVIIDFHAEATAEKICFAKFCSQYKVSAVLGTHTHVQTADEKIINDYTAYITDAGFCGVYDSVIGMAYETSLKRLITSIPERFDIDESKLLELNAVEMSFDAISGQAQSIKRINLIKDISEVKEWRKGRKVKVDLHIHTIYSDGVFSPEKIVDTAIDAGLNAIAITDHDNVLAYPIAVNYAQELAKQTNSTPLEILPGVEINTIYKDVEIHILGYFMDRDNSDFQAMLKSQQKARIKQTEEIIHLLNKKEGIHITFDKLKSLVAEGGSIGRPHIAKAITMVGGTNSVMDAYNKYINNESDVYVQRKTITPHEAIEIIYDAGGIPVFAHPFDVEDAENLIKEFMHYGLRGVEAYHRKHSPAMVEYYSSIAEKNGLIITGGSDFHAPNPNNGQIIMGKNFIPEWIYEKLTKEKKQLDLAR